MAIIQETFHEMEESEAENQLIKEVRKDRDYQERSKNKYKTNEIDSISIDAYDKQDEVPKEI